PIQVPTPLGMTLHSSLFPERALAPLPPRRRSDQENFAVPVSSVPAAWLLSGPLISWFAAVDPLLTSLRAKHIQSAREASDLPWFRQRVELQEWAVRVAQADLYGPVSAVPEDGVIDATPVCPIRSFLQK